MLERLAGKRRRAIEEPRNAYAKAVVHSRPAAYWRFGDIAGQMARDRLGARHGVYEAGYALYLDGAQPGARAVHLAGGRVRVPGLRLGGQYTVETVFSNGLDNHARAVTGYLWSCGGDALGIQGTAGEPGRLVFGPLTGRTAIAPNSWNHVAVVRDESRVIVYLNGEEEIRGKAPVLEAGELLLGAAAGEAATLEGRLDEAAIFPRPLAPARIRRHWAALGLPRVP
jgi:hypothetical protein